jgi:hypothetical protein
MSTNTNERAQVAPQTPAEVRQVVLGEADALPDYTLARDTIEAFIRRHLGIAADAGNAELVFQLRLELDQLDMRRWATEYAAVRHRLASGGRRDPGWTQALARLDRELADSTLPVMRNAIGRRR